MRFRRWRNLISYLSKMKPSTWSSIFQLLTVLCLVLIAWQLYRLEVKTTRTNKFIVEALQDAKKEMLDAVAPEDIIIGDPHLRSVYPPWQSRRRGKALFR